MANAGIPPTNIPRLIRGGAANRRVEEVPIDRLGQIWHMVRPGLEAVKRKTNPTWIPEDVYHVLMQNRAWLIMGYNNNEYVGFTIFSMEGDQFTGKAIPMIWIAYTNQKVPGMLEYVLSEVEKRLKGQGFNQIIMHSPRPGWARVAPKMGFRLRDVVYSKAI